MIYRYIHVKHFIKNFLNKNCYATKLSISIVTDKNCPSLRIVESFFVTDPKPVKTLNNNTCSRVIRKLHVLANFIYITYPLFEFNRSMFHYTRILTNFFKAINSTQLA